MNNYFKGFYAHRGLSSEFFENTERSFVQASRIDLFRGIETDIWLTKDNKLVCVHNECPFIDLKNDRKFLKQPIYETNFQDALSMPLYTRTDFNSKYKITGTFFVCSFEKYIDLCLLNNKVPLIEIKEPKLHKNLSLYHDLVCKQLVNYLENKKILDKVLIVSFSEAILDKLKNINCSLNLLHTPKLNEGKEKIEYFIQNNFFFDVHYLLLDENNVKKAKGCNLIVGAWTVNNKTWALKLNRWGVDLITTNIDPTRWLKKT